MTQSKGYFDIQKGREIEMKNYEKTDRWIKGLEIVMKRKRQTQRKKMETGS